jgi:hypothetical protein
MQHSSSSGSNSHSAKKFRAFFWSPKFRYRLHKSRLLFPMSSSIIACYLRKGRGRPHVEKKWEWQLVQITIHFCVHRINMNFGNTPQLFHLVCNNNMWREDSSIKTSQRENIPSCSWFSERENFTLVHFVSHSYRNNTYRRFVFQLKLSVLHLLKYLAGPKIRSWISGRFHMWGEEQFNTQQSLRPKWSELLLIG